MADRLIEKGRPGKQTDQQHGNIRPGMIERIVLEEKPEKMLADKIENQKLRMDRGNPNMPGQHDGGEQRGAGGKM